MVIGRNNLVVAKLRFLLSCWLSARGQLLEPTCRFLPCGFFHSMAGSPFKASRRASAATLNLSDFLSLTSRLFSQKADLIRSGPPTFIRKELWIYRVCTPGSRTLGSHCSHHRKISWVEHWRREVVYFLYLGWRSGWQESMHITDTWWILLCAKQEAADKADIPPALLKLMAQRPLEKFCCHYGIDYGDGCTSLCKYIKNH